MVTHDMNAQEQPAPITTQQAVEISSEAPPLSAPVNLGNVWLVYVLLAVLFLVLLYRWIRRWPKWAIVPLWSAFAAGALAPAYIHGATQFSAPAAIVAILSAEQNGVAGFIKGAMPIVVTYLALMLILSGIFWWLSQRHTSVDTNGEAPRSAETEKRSVEPKL